MITAGLHGLGHEMVGFAMEGPVRGEDGNVTRIAMLPGWQCCQDSNVAGHSMVPGKFGELCLCSKLFNLCSGLGSKTCWDSNVAEIAMLPSKQCCRAFNVAEQAMLLSIQCCQIG